MNYYRISTYCIAIFFIIAISGVSIAQPGNSNQGGAPGNQQEETNPPVIDSITITNAKKISEKDILENVSMKVGQKISITLVKTTCNEIAAMYQAKGGDAAVTPEITHPSEGHCAVELIVDENGTGGYLWPAPGSSGGGAQGGAPPGK